MSEIDITKAKGVFDKTVFSMVIPEVESILDADKTRKSVVLFGIEVCLPHEYMGGYFYQENNKIHGHQCQLLMVP